MSGAPLLIIRGLRTQDVPALACEQAYRVGNPVFLSRVVTHARASASWSDQVFPGRRETRVDSRGRRSCHDQPQFNAAGDG